MAEKVMPGPVGADACVREAACIHTSKIYDSCQAKDCAEDLLFYPTCSAQTVLDGASSLKNGKAELLYVDITVESVGLGRGFFTVAQQFYYRAAADAISGRRSVPVSGLLTFSKRSMLFGSESGALTFSSRDTLCGGLPLGESLPEAVCEAVDPIVLSMRLCDPTKEDCPAELDAGEFPEAIRTAFDEQVLIPPTGKRAYFTLGQFSILRLERDSQLLMPVYDNCVPSTQCENDDPGDDPCEVFQQAEFPVGEFIPPAASCAVDPMARLRGGACGRQR